MYSTNKQETANIHFSQNKTKQNKTKRDAMRWDDDVAAAYAAVADDEGWRRKIQGRKIILFLISGRWVFLCCLLYCILQLDCWHSPYFVVVLIIVGCTDGHMEMVVFFLGVGGSAERRTWCGGGFEWWMVKRWERNEERGVGSLYD